MDQVFINWVASTEYDDMLTAQWGKIKMRIYYDDNYAVRLDVFDYARPAESCASIVARRCRGFNEAKVVAAEWIATHYGQCQNGDVHGWRCPELATMVNDLGTRYCIACFERYQERIEATETRLAALGVNPL